MLTGADSWPPSGVRYWRGGRAASSQFSTRNISLRLVAFDADLGWHLVKLQRRLAVLSASRSTAVRTKVSNGRSAMHAARSMRSLSRAG